MFTRVPVLGVMLLLAALTPSAAGDGRMQATMRIKLSNTQAMLKAVVTADYKDIDRAAGELARISETEIGSWQSPPTREYTEQAMVFMTSVDDLRAASERHDLEGVGDAYSTLLTSCVHCHALVRGGRSASLKRPRPSTR